MKKIIKNREFKFIERFCRPSSFIMPRYDICFVKTTTLDKKKEFSVPNGEQVFVLGNYGKKLICRWNEWQILIDDEDLE